MKKEKRGEFGRELLEQAAKQRSSFAVYLVLRAVVIAALVLSVLGKRWENVFTCALTLVLFLLPVFLERRLRITLPNTLEIIIMLFVFAAEILGELSKFYVNVPHWDTILHTVNGFLCAAVGFALMDIINRDARIKFELSPLYLAVVAFCFSMTIGVLWEFFEFSMDRFFLRDMQKDTILHVISSVTLDPAGGNTPYIIRGITDAAVNGESLGLGGYLDIGLYDTMKDLFVNFIGAVVFSFIGYYYVKNRGEGGFAKNFIPTISEDAPPPDDITDSLE